MQPGFTSRKELYERDYYTWALEQGRALRAHDTEALDWDNLAEEVEGLARSEARELRSRLEVLLVHLLKWRYQPDKRSSSWRLTMREQRRRVAQIMDENPGLKSTTEESVTSAYEIARLVAAREPRLAEKRFPPASPWSFERIVAEDFWPTS
jgi:hypothetical protein